MYIILRSVTESGNFKSKDVIFEFETLKVPREVKVSIPVAPVNPSEDKSKVVTTVSSSKETVAIYIPEAEYVCVAL